MWIEMRQRTRLCRQQGLAASCSHPVSIPAAERLDGYMASSACSHPSRQVTPTGEFARQDESIAPTVFYKLCYE